MKINRFLDLNAIIPLPLVPQISDGQVIDAVPVMALANYIAAAVNANAQPITSGPVLAQWQYLGVNGTFISTTSFSVPGNYLATFYPANFPGLKLQTTNTGGTVYSYVVNASFGGGITTVTVVNVGGAVLDAGLSTVNIGILGSSTGNTIPSSAVPQKSIVQYLWGHNTDVIATTAPKVISTANGFSVVSGNYGGGGLFPVGSEYNSATGLFTPSRDGYYQISTFIQINTTGVTFSGSSIGGTTSGGAMNFSTGFVAGVQANTAYASLSYVDYLSGPIGFGLLCTFSAGTPVFVGGIFTIVGPL